MPPWRRKELEAVALEIERELAGHHARCLHRTGTLAVGDIAVICAASAAHPSEAFSACRELIDRLEARGPIWKRQHGEQGSYWVGWQDVRGGDRTRQDASA
jgi:molybdopterin synthase catalytic subunit